MAFGIAPHHVVEQFGGKAVAAFEQGGVVVIDQGGDGFAKSGGTQPPGAVFGNDLNPNALAANARGFGGHCGGIVTAHGQTNGCYLTPACAAGFGFGFGTWKGDVDSANGFDLHEGFSGVILQDISFGPMVAKTSIRFSLDSCKRFSYRAIGDCSLMGRDT